MEDKKQQIIEQTCMLFHRYGIKSVGMDDISRELGMSKKTLYQNVKDKTELVEAAMEYIKDYMTNSLSVFHDESLNAIEQHLAFGKLIKDRLLNNNPTLIFDLRKYYPMLFQNMNSFKRQAIYDAHLANLEKGKRENLYQDDVDSHLIAKILVSFHVFTFDPTNELFTESEVVSIKTIEEVYKYHFRGICTEKGMKELYRLFCTLEGEK